MSQPSGAARRTGPVEPVDVDVERIRDAVLAVPGVVGLHSGLFGEIGTHLPGRRVAGVRRRPDGIEVHVVVAADADVRATATAVHAAVRTRTGAPVHVVVEDLGNMPSPRRS